MSVLDEFKSMDELVSGWAKPTSNHTIRRGETLSQIAERFGTTVREISRLNPEIRDPDKIIAGKELVIPNPKAYGESKATDEDWIGRFADMSPAQRPSIEEGMVEESIPEDIIPLLKMAGVGLGAAGLANGLPKLAGAMPKALPQAGQVLPRGGAWRGVGQNAKPAMNNVRPYGPGRGAAYGPQNKMATNMAYQRPMAETLHPNPERLLANQGRALNTLGPELYKGVPNQAVRNEAASQSIRKALLKMEGKADPRGNMLNDIIAASSHEPTLNTLASAGRAPITEVPFQELLRRVGYGR